MVPVFVILGLLFEVFALIGLVYCLFETCCFRSVHFECCWVVCLCVNCGVSVLSWVS